MSKEILMWGNLRAVKQDRLVLARLSPVIEITITQGGFSAAETGENPVLNNTDGAIISPSNIHQKSGTKVKRC